MPAGSDCRSNVAAHGQAKGIVLERHDVMVDIRDANKSIGNMVRGKAALDRARIRALALRLPHLREDASTVSGHKSQPARQGQ